MMLLYLMSDRIGDLDSLKPAVNRPARPPSRNTGVFVDCTGRGDHGQSPAREVILAIDPMLYKKYSGRSGDPYERLGAALAQSSAQKSQLKAAKEVSLRERMIVNHYKAKIVLSVIGGIGLVV